MHLVGTAMTGTRLNNATLLLAAVLVGAEDPAAAGSAPGWYAGGGLSINNVFSATDEGIYGSSQRGSAATGFVVNAGYRWHRNLAVEFGYLNGGEPDFDTVAVDPAGLTGLYAVDVRQETTALEASIVAILPLRNIWELYMKGGIALWDASSAQVLTPLSGGNSISRQVDADGTDFMLGIGAGIDIGDKLHARLEYQAFRTSDELLAASSDREARFDVFSLELHWRFVD